MRPVSKQLPPRVTQIHRFEEVPHEGPMCDATSLSHSLFSLSLHSPSVRHICLPRSCLPLGAQGSIPYVLGTLVDQSQAPCALEQSKQLMYADGDPCLA